MEQRRRIGAAAERHGQRRQALGGHLLDRSVDRPFRRSRERQAEQAAQVVLEDAGTECRRFSRP